MAITLSWTTFSTEGNFSSIEVHRSGSEFTPDSGTLLATVDGSINEYVDSTASGQFYFYALVGIESSGTRRVMDSFRVDLPSMGSVPQPSINSHTVDGVTVTFSASAYGGNDTHQTSDWLVVKLDNKGVAYSIEDTTNLESIGLDLFSSGDYQASVRYSGSTADSIWANWYAFNYTFEGIPPVNITPRSISTNGSGNMFVGGMGVVYKIAQNGNIMWEFVGGLLSNSDVVGIDSDTSGNVYVGTSHAELYKIDSSGEHAWVYTEHTDDILCVAVDASGNVYSGSLSKELRKVDTNGNYQWTYTSTGIIYDIYFDSNGDLLIATGGEIQKINASGNMDWSVPTPSDAGSATAIVVDSADNIYYVSSADDSIRKLDSTGNEITIESWPYTAHTDLIMSLAIDDADNVYSTSSSGDQTVRKISSIGEEQWIFSGHTWIVRDVAVDSIYVYSAGQDNTVRVIDRQTGNQVMRIPE